MTDTLAGYDFVSVDTTTDDKLDTVPVTIDVNHPCDSCGRETGWTGRGRRKKLCDDCKPKPATTRTPRITGNASNLAAQGAKSLVGINNLVGFGLLALGFHATAKTIMDVQNDFEGQAYQALLTDPKLAQSILSAGAVSGKMMLGMAYLTMGVGVAPTAMAELKAKKAANLAAGAED